MRAIDFEGYLTKEGRQNWGRWGHTGDSALGGQLGRPGGRGSGSFAG